MNLSEYHQLDNQQLSKISSLEERSSTIKNKPKVIQNKNMDKLNSAANIPYPRTSGATFCPNGQILGM